MNDTHTLILSISNWLYERLAEEAASSDLLIEEKTKCILEDWFEAIDEEIEMLESQRAAKFIDRN